MISSSFLSFFISEIIQEMIIKSLPIEKSLHTLGRKIAPYLIELYEFNRDIDLDSLIYKITYIFLPHIFTTTRKISKRENIYFISENVPLIMSYMSIPSEGFSADALIAGIIESVINATGYECNVNAYTAPENGFPRKTIYSIEIIHKEIKEL
ncbi:hypothetical protein H311_02608, partial [Anncaliia algerae PRA109]